jgi:hypothetical protein
MKFHWPSFFIGYGAGAASVLFAKQLRPILLEVATAAYRLSDAVAARAAMWWEDIDDVLAEGKARVRSPRPSKPVRVRAHRATHHVKSTAHHSVGA